MNKVEKMEQALDASLSFIGNLEIDPHSHLDEVASELRDKILDARAMPKRQCDVGTAEEQSERYRRYCDKFTSDGMHCETCPCCGKIPFGKCEFAWAQMPYEADASFTKNGANVNSGFAIDMDGNKAEEGGAE